MPQTLNWIVIHSGLWFENSSPGRILRVVILLVGEVKVPYRVEQLFFFSKTFLHLAAFLLLSTLASFPVPADEKHHSDHNATTTFLHWFGFPPNVVLGSKAKMFSCDIMRSEKLFHIFAEFPTSFYKASLNDGFISIFLHKAKVYTLSSLWNSFWYLSCTFLQTLFWLLSVRESNTLLSQSFSGLCWIFFVTKLWVISWVSEYFRICYGLLIAHGSSCYCFQKQLYLYWAHETQEDVINSRDTHATNWPTACIRKNMGVHSNGSKSFCNQNFILFCVGFFFVSASVGSFV